MRRGMVAVLGLVLLGLTASADEGTLLPLADDVPCSAERAEADRLDRQLGAPMGRRFMPDFQRARDALIACERRIEDAEQAERLKRSIAERDAKRAREADERQREREAFVAEERARREPIEAARRAAEELRRTVAADPKNQRIAFSALQCAAARNERDARREIAEYKQASRIGGVINLAAIGARQDVVMEARREQAAARTQLGRLKVSPLPCKHPAVASAAQCVTMTITGVCDETARAIAAIVRGDN